jgi:hypothetical protein
VNCFFAASGALVTAITIVNELMSVPGLVMYAFSPSIDQRPSGNARARVVDPAVSEPACGSVPASEQIFLPATTSGNQSRFSFLAREARKGEAGGRVDHCGDGQRLVDPCDLLDRQHEVERAEAEAPQAVSCGIAGMPSAVSFRNSAVGNSALRSRSSAPRRHFGIAKLGHGALAAASARRSD